jgi:hypothetical protein
VSVTPIPEPGILCLLAVAPPLLGLGVYHAHNLNMLLTDISARDRKIRGMLQDKYDRCRVSRVGIRLAPLTQLQIRASSAIARNRRLTAALSPNADRLSEEGSCRKEVGLLGPSRADQIDPPDRPRRV